ncbi:MAG: hypothetical protein AAGC85_09865, partial [Bacteroidota bacterium]
MKFLCSTILFSLAFCPLWSQPELFLTHLDRKDGLTGNRIITIFQDSIGFVWFVSEEGLNRFDGKRIKNYQYDPANHQSNVPQLMVNVSLDPKDRVWMPRGRLGGISTYIPQEDTFFTYLEHEDYGINNFYTDHLNRTWIATSTRGLLLFKPETGDVSSFPPLSKYKLAPFYGTYLSEDNRGRFWFSDQNGIYQYSWDSSNSPKYYAFRDQIKRLEEDYMITTKVFQDSRGDLWVGSRKGLFKFDETNDVFLLTPLK